MIDEVKVNLLNIMKKENLIDLIHEYSDYTIDMGGVSIERFIDKEYLKNKRKEDVLIKSEIEEQYIDEYDIIKKIFNEHSSINTDRDTNSLFNKENSYHDLFKHKLYEALEKYKKENW